MGRLWPQHPPLLQRAGRGLLGPHPPAAAFFVVRAGPWRKFSLCPGHEDAAATYCLLPPVRRSAPPAPGRQPCFRYRDTSGLNPAPSTGTQRAFVGFGRHPLHLPTCRRDTALRQSEAPSSACFAPGHEDAAPSGHSSIFSETLSPRRRDAAARRLREWTNSPPLTRGRSSFIEHKKGEEVPCPRPREGALSYNVYTGLATPSPRSLRRRQLPGYGQPGYSPCPTDPGRRAVPHRAIPAVSSLVQGTPLDKYILDTINKTVLENAD